MYFIVTSEPLVSKVNVPFAVIPGATFPSVIYLLSSVLSNISILHSFCLVISIFSIFTFQFAVSNILYPSEKFVYFEYVFVIKIKHIAKMQYIICIKIIFFDF